MASAAPEHFRPLRRVEYDRLVALGTFHGERIELMAGELRRMSPIGPPHTSTVDRLTELLVVALDDAHPDVAHLIIEVADSSLSYDRGQKARLYAECGVPEYWIVNLASRVVEVHRDPSPTGYENVSIHPKGARLQLLAFPDVELAVDAFLR
jgi:hypothetical protein